MLRFEHHHHHQTIFTRNRAPFQARKLSITEKEDHCNPVTTPPRRKNHTKLFNSQNYFSSRY